MEMPKHAHYAKNAINVKKIEQIPKHIRDAESYHSMYHNPLSIEAGYLFNDNVVSSRTGGDEPHSHDLDFYRTYFLFYKRIK